MTDLTAISDYYELRLYRCVPGRVPDLHHRMGYEVTHLFERHGISQPLVYWDGFAGSAPPVYGYLLRWNDLDARFRAFGNFYTDPEWLAQYHASNAGEHMIDRLDLSFLRPAPDWTAGVDIQRMAAARGLHELRLQRLSTRNSPEGVKRLAEEDLAILARHGATILGLFTVWFGSRMPQAVMLIEWPDFATREAAMAAHDANAAVSARLRDERARYGRPLLLDSDVLLLRPTRYGRSG